MKNNYEEVTATLRLPITRELCAVHGRKIRLEQCPNVGNEGYDKAVYSRTQRVLRTKSNKSTPFPDRIDQKSMCSNDVDIYSQ
jgi:hypothetical protein